MKTADFYSSATGTLRVNGGRDENAPAGVSLSIDDLSYIKQGSRANEGNTGTTDYNDLTNKPLINSVELKGSKSLNDLGIQSKIDSSHKVLADNIDDTNTTNKFATAAQLAQIETNKNNILLVEQNIRKNIATINNGTNAIFLQIPVSVVANKSYQISIASLTSDETSEEQACRITLMNNDNVASNIIYMTRGNNKTGVLTTTGAANSLWIYASGSYQSSVGKSVTVANLMLCDKALYDAGYTDYQPYIPTVEDIMAMINQ